MPCNSLTAVQEMQRVNDKSYEIFEAKIQIISIILFLPIIFFIHLQRTKDCPNVYIVHKSLSFSYIWVRLINLESYIGSCKTEYIFPETTGADLLYQCGLG